MPEVESIYGGGGDHEDDLSEDDKKRESDAIQKTLDQFILKVDDLVKEKESEIRTI